KSASTGRELAAVSALNLPYSNSALVWAISWEMRPDVALVECQEAVELLDPVRHVHGNAAHRLSLGKDEVLLHEVVQRGQLRLRQVVLGDGDILLANRRPA